MSSPWSLREHDDAPEDAAVVASRLTLANGWVGVRGVLDERGPDAGPGTLLAAVHDDEDHVYAEGGYGYPPTLERIVPVADAWRTAVRVDGVPLDRATAAEHERTLRLDAGVLERRTRWRAADGSGATVDLRGCRLVSLVRRSVVAQRWELEADAPVDVVVVPDAGCHPGTGPLTVPAGSSDAGDDPHDDGRSGARVVTQRCAHEAAGSRILQHTTRSEIGVAALTRHLVALDGLDGSDGDAGPGGAGGGDDESDGGRGASGPDDATGPGWAWADGPDGAELHVRLVPGRRLVLTVLVAFAVGPRAAALEDDAERALADAEAAGWEHLVAEQADYLASVWERGDVVVEGDDQMQQAVRYAVFQVVQAAAQVEGVGVRAKGLTGAEYHGHTFWDSECFILPVLDHVLPSAAAAHLRWRHSTLPHARDRAAQVGLAGAVFPWRTITGRESSGYWPAGSAAYHVGADITHAVARHLDVTQDEAFAREVGAEIAVETARMWASRGHHADDGFHLHGVTGPDEYTAVVDDNAYTNLMARRNLRTALTLTTDPDVAARLGVTAAERSAWQLAVDRMVVPRRGGITEQHAGFTQLAPWPFRTEYPVQEHAPFWEIYRHQVVKQADVVMALHLAGDDVDDDQKRRDFEYYEPLTVRDSSLSAPAQAVVAAEVGHGDLAWAYTRETALIDLLDMDGSTGQGLHVAALAGAWTALVAGFGGLRHGTDRVRLAPRLPCALRRLSFRLERAGAAVRVDVRPDVARYELVSGPALALRHHGGPVDLTTASPVAELPVPPWPDLVPPTQPPGRAPRAGDEG